MPASKFEADGVTPRLTIRDRLIAEFSQLTPDQFQAGINLSEIRLRLEETTQKPIAWSGLYKAYQKLREDQEKGNLLEAVQIPTLQETHSRETRGEVVRLRREGVPHAEIARRLGVSKARSLSVASEEGVATSHKAVTQEEKDYFVDLWEHQGLTGSQIREAMNISEGRFAYLRDLLGQDKRIGGRGPDMVEMGVRNGVILTLAKQGYTPAETQQVLHTTYGYDVDIDKIYGMLRDFRYAGQLPKFSNRSELYQWRETQRRTHTDESMQAQRTIAARVEEQVSTLLSTGGAITFKTDRMGTEVFDVSVTANAKIPEDLMKQTGVRSVPLSYIRKLGDSNVQGELIFDSRVAAFLYDIKSDVLRVERSQHGKLLLRTLELLRTNIILEISEQLHVELIAEEEIPTVRDIMRKLALV